MGQFGFTSGTFLTHVAITDHGDGIFREKEFLKTAGWTVLASGDGLAAFSSSGDIITSGGSGAGGMFNVLAWFRIQAPDLVHEWTIQLISTVNTVTSFRFKYGLTPFTGGAASSTQTPTATDEVVFAGAGTDAAPTGERCFGNMAQAGAKTLYGGADQSAPYGFFFAVTLGAANEPGIHGFLWEPMQDAPMEDADPYVLYLYREAVASSNDAWNLIEYRNISDAETEQPQCWLDYPAGAFQNIGGVEYDNENTLILPGDVNVNPHSAESDLVPIFYHRFNTLPDPDGPKGVGSLIVGFCPVDTGSRLESLTVAGVTAAYIRVGRNYSAPWDGSTPSGYSEITGKLWAGGYATKFVVGSPVGLPEDIAGGFSAA